MKWTITDESILNTTADVDTLGAITPLAPRDPSCDFLICADEFTRLSLAAHVGSLKLLAHTLGFEGEVNPGFLKIATALSLKVFREIAVNPTELILFLHEDNTGVIEISHGMDQFQVTSSQKKRIARVNYRQTNQSIHVTPVDYGKLSISVAGEALRGSRSAICTVKIVSAESIEIVLEDYLIEQHLHSAVKVRVYSTGRKEIPSAQYKHMNIKLELVTENESGVSNPVKIKRVAGRSDEFQVLGVSIGDFKIIASLENRKTTGKSKAP